MKSRSRRFRRRTNKRLRRKSRGKRTRVSRRRINKYFGGKIVNSEQLPQYNGNNILLIIDPQNDFSDAKEGSRVTGNLAVTGATADYSRIISFIEKNVEKLNEIHVSLDTHTDRHIGHPAFWSRVNENGEVINDNPYNTDDTDGLRILSIVDGKNNIYKGTSVVSVLGREFDGGENIRYYTPRKYTEEQYSELLSYVKEYIKFYSYEQSKHGQLPWIWRKHCIEGTEGHKVAAELKSCLDKYPDKVKYHIKGQNNLAEMYSIFSAERPVSEEESRYLSNYLYTGSASNTNLPTDGVPTYEEVIQYKNLKTDSNTDLMQHLLGENNRVFICGEAKTHCVKSSLIDLMENASGLAENRIILLSNMTSPISGELDDIVYITDKKPFTVFNPIDSIDLIPIIDNSKQ